MVSSRISGADTSTLPLTMAVTHAAIVAKLASPYLGMLLDREHDLYRQHVEITGTKPNVIFYNKRTIYPPVFPKKVKDGEPEWLHESLTPQGDELYAMYLEYFVDANIINSVLGVVLRNSKTVGDAVAVFGEVFRQVLSDEVLGYHPWVEDITLTPEEISVLQEKYSEGINKIQNRIVFVTLLV